MKGKKRRLIAIGMSIAMILVGLEIAPNKVEAATAYAANTWAPASTSVWHVKGMRSGSYEGGSSLSGPFAVTIDSYKESDGDVKIESPIISVTSGVQYTITATVNTTVEYSNLRLQAISGTTYYASGSGSNPSTVIAKGDIAHTANTNITWTGTYTPTSSTMTLLFVSGWSNAGTITISNVSVQPTSGGATTVEPTTVSDGYTAATADGAWHTVPTNGFQYKFKSGMAVRYKGGTSISDPFDTLVQTTASNGDHDFQTKTPTVSVSAGSIYKLTYNIENIGTVDEGAHVYATVTNAANDTDITSNYNNQISVAHGADEDIELTYTAPASGQVYFKLNISYTKKTEFVLTPTNQLITAYTACTIGDWAFAGANNTGWQYYVAGAGSAYRNGTTLASGLQINYGTYVESADTCMVRTPITQVTEGNTCTGSITFNNGSDYDMSGVTGSVCAYDSSTGSYTFYASSTEGAQNVTAGNSVTFNFSYTAPASGYIVYVATTSYTPSGILGFSATHNEQEPVTTEPTTTVTSDDLDVTGYQITPYYNNESGRIGSRVIYQANSTVDGKTPTEVGLVYALTGYETINDDDVVVGSTISTTINGSDYPLVYSYAATNAGNVTSNFSSTPGTSYYARTMSTNNSVTGFTATYYIRAYAKFSDNSYAYSDIYTFRAYDVADYLYQNHLLISKAAHDLIYNTVLVAVTPSYAEVDYVWDKTMVDPTAKQ